MAESGRDGELGSPSRRVPAVSFGTAAFILIRVKRAFRRKKAKMKSSAREATTAGGGGGGRATTGKPAPLYRSRTLPAIVVPVHLTADIAQHLNNKAEEGSSPHRVAPADCFLRPLVTVTADCEDGQEGEMRVLVGGEEDCAPSSRGSSSSAGPMERLTRLLTKEPRRDGEYRRRTHSLERTPGGSGSRRSSMKELLVSLSMDRRRSLRLNELPSHQQLYWKDASSGKYLSGTPRRSASVDSLVDQTGNNNNNNNNNCITYNHNSLLVPGSAHHPPPCPPSFRGNGAARAAMPASPSPGKRPAKPDRAAHYGTGAWAR
ncbi:uncharacterized protein LOC108673724 [Hyalella azteca]|uniref:Uncharacterized protein LOC108673724 n=1 Tax=Hyalella azteca TaxID=294128 RepID=A0A8B7NTP5_HYAAZ|nr:uncharacterized protein LOC108673724 [Hyalella azteca]